MVGRPGEKEERMDSIEHLPPFVPSRQSEALSHWPPPTCPTCPTCAAARRGAVIQAVSTNA